MSIVNTERLLNRGNARHQVDYSEMDFHKGRMLIMAAGKYKTLLAACLEGEQNALDADATFIQFIVDRTKRNIEITDNGNGTSQDEFGVALKQIGMSIKSKGKMGRFNLGGKAFLGKCNQYIFTSCPKGRTEYREWVFKGKELEKQADLLRIPSFIRNELQFSSRLGGTSSVGGKVFVPWRTRIYVENYTTDSIIGHLDIHELRDGILDAFSVDMRRLKTVVRIVEITESGKQNTLEARATEYMGKPLKEEYFPRGANPPNTILQLFLAPRRMRGRGARIHFGEMGNSARMNEKQFCMSVLGVLDEEVRKTLVSGIFEGQILTRTARWSPERESFDRNEGLIELCIHLKEWYDEVGKKIVEEIREDKKDLRYQDIGVRVMRWIENELKLPEWEHLISGFSLGNIGEGHAKPKKREIKGSTENKEISTEGGSFKPRNWKNENDEVSDDKSHKEKERHIPVTVVGPRGRKRILVAGKSVGITLEISEMLGESRAYRLLSERGVVEINSRFPLFVKCDEAGDIALAKYQQFIVMEALILHSQPPEFQECQELAFSQLLKLEVPRILSGDRPLRKSKAIHT